MRYVTVLGAGLLVGTALAVIVPEGVHALYMSELETNQMQTQHEFQADHKIVHRHLHEIEHDAQVGIAQNVKAGNDAKGDVLPPAHQHTADHPRELGAELGHKHTDTTHSAIGINIFRKLTKKNLIYLGVTLILGFVFMLIIDNCGSRLLRHHGSPSMLKILIYTK